MGVRAGRIVDALKEEVRVRDERVVAVLRGIVSSEDLGRAKRLALVALDGRQPGTVGWARVSKLLVCASFTGFCKQCNEGVCGEARPHCPEIYEDLCPAEFGAVRYAEVCAA